MTVAELKRRMSMRELGSWVAYAQEVGPLSLPWRIEYAIARAVAPFLTGSDNVRKFMVWPKEPEREASIEDIMNVLKGAKIEKERSRG